MKTDESFFRFASFFPSQYKGGGYICARIGARDYSAVPEDKPQILTGAAFNILVLYGSLTVNIDNSRYVCTSASNSYIDCKPMNILSGMLFSKDFDGYLFSISKELIDSISEGKKPMLNDMLTLRSVPVMTLDGRQKSILTNCFVQILKSSVRKDNIFSNDITEAWLKIFMSESLNIVFSLGTLRKIEPPDHKENLCNRFSELLLENVSEEHEVAFYADKLCITPRYLSKITQEILGISSSALIADELVSKAILLLRTSSSLKEIADALHFSDQAAFGKFFKKHTGFSPAAFRSKDDRHY